MRQLLQKSLKSFPDILPAVLVIFFGLLASRDLLLPGYFQMHDDLQMMRQLEMEKCFADGQVPCRWVPDMGYGFGYPLFNYYPPLPYLVGQGMRLLGAAFTTTVKLTFLASLVLSGLAMYVLAKTFWGRLGGMLSAIFYIWAPYRAVDIFVRGAMNESWSFVWFPLIFWSVYRLIKEGKFRWMVILALSWAFLFLSHNVMVLIFAPVFAVWCLLWLWKLKGWGRIPELMISGIWGFALAAFFSLPILLEKNLVQIETLTAGYYEYIAHFVNLNQLFISRFWGYGPSVWGDGDGMPFPIGHFHWGLALIIAILFLVKLLRKEKIRNEFLLLIGFFLVVGFGSAFMTHLRSIYIWQALPFLSILQFPWRFLTLSTFALSFLVGVVAVLNGRKKWVPSLVIILAIVVVTWNFEFFKAESVGRQVTDSQKFSGEAWRIQQTAGIYDYLPRAAKIAPQAARKEPLELLEGEAVLEDIKEGTNWIKFKASVEGESARVRINIFQFPNWRVFIDGKETETGGDNDELGRIHIMMPEGRHEVYVRLYDTWPRTTGNLISLVSWLVLLSSPLWVKRIKGAKI